MYRVKNNKAEKIAITPSVGDDQNIAVSGPISAGDLVVVRGAERLEDESLVEILDAIAIN